MAAFIVIDGIEVVVIGSGPPERHSFVFRRRFGTAIPDPAPAAMRCLLKWELRRAALGNNHRTSVQAL